MGKILKVPQTLKRDVWAFIIVPLFMAILPYGIVWVFWPPSGVRETLTDIRFTLAFLAIMSIVLTRAKIWADEMGLLYNRNLESGISIFLTFFFIYPAGVSLVLFYLPALVVLIIAVRYSKKAHSKKTSTFERMVRTIMFCVCEVGVIFYGVCWPVLVGFSLGYLVVLLYLIVLLVLMGIAHFESAKDILIIKQISDGVIYILCITCSNVFGMPVTIEGSFEEGFTIIVSTHEGTADYFIWPIVLGWIISLIIAGGNLKDFPIVGDFIQIKAIMVSNRGGAKKRIEAKTKNFLLALIIKYYFKVFSRPDSQGGNADVIRQVLDAKKKGIIVWLPPDGRERISHYGDIKKIEPVILRFIEYVTPVLVIGPLRYKPATKKEPLAKPWYKFQFWCSPRKMRVRILARIYKFEGETPEEFSERIYQIMLREKRKLLSEMRKKRNVRIRRVKKTVKIIEMPFRWTFNRMFNEYGMTG